MNTRKFSKKQEDIIAKKFGGKRVANSGATTFLKGDVDLGNILVEAKTTIDRIESFRVKKEWLEKLDKERYSMRKDFAALAFQFEQNGQNYYVLDERAFKEFVRSCNDTNKN